uniref:Small ribosomal subunit protein uS10c n=1 Tax=Hommersandiophycus borowitzkae TaxID=268573 RepID=A0A1G4NU88_9FLOR|nr:Ribosomal protein S10 [Hommersandiophycus borowitzkae]SCW22230.1 Ribosomal protein S10 [Hommersandiophycus borowitzkae]
MDTEQTTKIRIKLKAYNHILLNTSCNDIINTANRTNARSVGPVPLPTHRRIYCVLRSPHVDKDSREHFELRTHKKIIDIYDPSSHTIDALMKLNLPAGVDIEVKL